MLISGVLKILQQHLLISQQYFSNIAFYFTNNAGTTLPADVPTLLKQHNVTNSQTNQRCAFERTVPDQNSRVARFELRCIVCWSNGTLVCKIVQSELTPGDVSNVLVDEFNF
jgi:hypothetical protein